MFEPNRLAAASLEAAYGQIVPTPWRRAGGGPELRVASSRPGEQARSIMPPARGVRHG